MAPESDSLEVANKNHESAIYDSLQMAGIVEALREQDMAKLEEVLKKYRKELSKNIDLATMMKEYRSPQFGTLLHIVSMVGNRNLCQYLIGLGIPVNSTDSHNNTPLHKASMAGRLDLLDLLLKVEGVDDTVLNDMGKTPLEVAKSKDCVQVLEHHRKVFVHDKTKVIFEAVKDSKFSFIKQLWTIPNIKNSLDINIKDNGDTILHTVAKISVNDSNGLEFVKWLLEQGADPFVKNNKGKLPIEVARDEEIKTMLKEVPPKPTPISQGEIRLEGHLDKWTNYASGYKKRFLVLENGVLSYYKTQTDYPVSCRGSIHLKVAKILVDPTDRNRFDVVARNSIRYHLRADTSAEAKRWVIGLTESKKSLNDSGSRSPPTLESSPSVGSLEDDEKIFKNQITSCLSQLELYENMTNSFHEYINTNGSEEMKNMEQGIYNAGLNLFSYLHSILATCERRESYWTSKLESETEKEQGITESLQILAIENDKLMQERQDPIEEEEDEHFYDAVEEQFPVISTVTEKPDLLGYPMIYRKQLPPRSNMSVSVSLWSVLKNAIGKDLSKMPIPVSFNEPISMLQRLCEDMEYSQLLDIASLKENSLERIQFVAAFAASNYSSTDGRTGKPFNPLLGETFEFVSRDKGFRYVSEQVSHHPPISACYCESDNYIFWSEVNVKTKFWGKSLEVVPMGITHVILKRTNEHYSWKKITTCVHNIIVGSLWIDHYGTLSVLNHTTQEKCLLVFKPTGWRGKDSKMIEGQAFDDKGVVTHEIEGKWNEKLCSKPLNGNSPFVLWKKNNLPADAKVNFQFTEFACQLNECSEELKSYLCPTDSRLRPDQRAMELGDYDKATQFKSQLEEKQRAVRKQRESIGMDYSPRWFNRDLEEDTNEEHWVFKGGYWESRSQRKWSEVEDIFIRFE